MKGGPWKTVSLSPSENAYVCRDVNSYDRGESLPKVWLSNVFIGSGGGCRRMRLNGAECTDHLRGRWERAGRVLRLITVQHKDEHHGPTQRRRKKTGGITLQAGAVTGLGKDGNKTFSILSAKHMPAHALAEGQLLPQ